MIESPTTPQQLTLDGGTLKAPFPAFGGKSRIAAKVWEALGPGVRPPSSKSKRIEARRAAQQAAHNSPPSIRDHKDLWVVAVEAMAERARFVVDVAAGIRA